MSNPPVVSCEEWLVARKELLAGEKALTLHRDEVNTARRELPMVKVDKDYVFVGPAGSTSLLDIFEGRRQLIVHHVMWLFDKGEACPSCTSLVSNIGNVAELHAKSVTLALVSRGPFDQIEAYRARMGWRLPWFSSHGSDFNYDFHVTLDEAVAPIEYNYRTKAELEQAGMGWVADQPEQPGHSVFLRVGDDVYHTYSTFARGGDILGSYTTSVDLTPFGRQEDWEKPEGRSINTRDPIPSGNK
jgi:predicted dithiol-disulfide oxidoreductase (DUF899 family)